MTILSQSISGSAQNITKITPFQHDKDVPRVQKLKFSI
jgi:hypothetical protein